MLIATFQFITKHQLVLAHDQPAAINSRGAARFSRRRWMTYRQRRTHQGSTARPSPPHRLQSPTPRRLHADQQPPHSGTVISNTAPAEHGARHRRRDAGNQTVRSPCHARSPVAPIYRRWSSANVVTGHHNRRQMTSCCSCLAGRQITAQ